MPVRIRLARRGRKKKPVYDVVVANSRAPRDGRFIEKIGAYNPHTSPATIDLDEAAALRWVLQGAQPSDTVLQMLRYRGVMLRKHLQIGVLKGAISQEDADRRYEEWRTEKDAKIRDRIARESGEKESERRARLEAEAQVSQARAAERQKRLEEAALAAAAEAAAAAGEETADANEETEPETTE
ncbi:MAG: 30S ribosomal protein S16 [Bernardetiaceae bacterium]